MVENNGENIMEEIVNELIRRKETISTMESCTGGGVANEITNIPGASAVIEFSAVTYSNKFKIKMGVKKDIIETYTVYSMEVARAMAFEISNFAGSNYGIGVTGQINRIDPANIVEECNKIYAAIYDRKNDIYKTVVINAIDASRKENKEYIIDEIVKLMREVLQIKKQKELVKIYK